MKKFFVEIECENTAFGEYAREEVARILREVVKRIEKTGLPDYPVPLLDINGNQVGSFTVDD